VQLPDDTLADLQHRLRRAEGQVRAVQRMLDDERDCRDVLTQLSAATRALEQTGFLLVAAGMQLCLTDPEASSAEGLDLEAVQKLFLKLA
jgi:DNA-binding FrmR family transcriptional regulator